MASFLLGFRVDHGWTKGGPWHATKVSEDKQSQPFDVAYVDHGSSLHIQISYQKVIIVSFRRF